MRLAKEGGPIQVIALKLQEKAIEAAFEAAGVTGHHAVAMMKTLAEDSGWLSNCDTVDDFVKKVMAKFPMLKDLKGAGPVFKQLK